MEGGVEKVVAEDVAGDCEEERYHCSAADEEAEDGELVGVVPDWIVGVAFDGEAVGYGLGVRIEEVEVEDNEAGDAAEAIVGGGA